MHMLKQHNSCLATSAIWCYTNGSSPMQCVRQMLQQTLRTAQLTYLVETDKNKTTWCHGHQTLPTGTCAKLTPFTPPATKVQLPVPNPEQTEPALHWSNFLSRFLSEMICLTATGQWGSENENTKDFGTLRWVWPPSLLVQVNKTIGLNRLSLAFTVPACG